MAENRILNEIYASPERVWQVLADLPGYPRWNPLFRSISGQITPGAPLEVHLALPGDRVWVFSAQVLDCQPGRAFRWRGFRRKPYLLSLAHALEIHPLEPERVRISLRLAFGGLLAPFLLGGVNKAVRPGLIELGQAIKEEAEGISPSETGLFPSANQHPWVAWGRFATRPYSSDWLMIFRKLDF